MRKSLKLETSLVRIAQMKRGWTLAQFARRCGLKPHSLGSQISMGFPNAAGRRRIEAAFDYAEPIFSSASMLAARKRCRDEHGADPCLLSHAELKRLAVRIGLPGAAAHRNKSELLNAVLLHLTLTEQQSTQAH